MESKQDIRERIWRHMQNARVALFPGAPGRIPNFVGTARALEHLSELDAWKRAEVVKCNPDLPQRPLRKRALEEGKIVYMTVPRLTSLKCFLELDPRVINNYSFASSIKGAFRVGRLVHPREMTAVDLIVCGSVAARSDGARLGKGGGFSDLEYALARDLGLVDSRIPVLTTVHPIQVVDEPIPMAGHDIVLDYIATPDRIIECRPAYSKPDGIYWDEVGTKVDEVPILRELRERQVG